MFTGSLFVGVEMETTEGFYCPKCGKFVLPRQSKFNHPYEGEKSCYVCAKCWGMVYMKDQV